MAEQDTQYGGFWIRFLALLVDSATLFIFACVLLILAALAGFAAGPEAMTLVVLVYFLVYLLYWPVMHASARQATFGKAMLGLKVTGYDGNRISLLRSIGRFLATFISGAVFMLGYLVAGFTKRKQSLHDLIASTYVVREGRAQVVAALAAAVAGFVLPVVLLPMVVGGAAMAMMSGLAEGMMSQPDPMKQAARPASPAVAKAAPVVVAKAAPKPQPPAPTQAAPTPAPVQPPAAPVAVAAPAPIAAVPLPRVTEPEPVAKPKPAPARVAAARKPKPVAVFEPKAMPSPKFNDLMTAVLYRDAEGVSELLRLGKWPDKPDPHGTTPLMTAVELGDAASAEALLRAGASASRAIPVAEERRDSAMLDLLKRYSAR